MFKMQSSHFFCLISMLLTTAKLSHASGEQSNQKILQSSIEATLMKYFDVKEDEVSFLVKSVRYDFEKQIATFDLEAVLHLEMILRSDDSVSGEKRRANKPRKGRRSVLNGTDSLNEESLGEESLIPETELTSTS
ncbi:uncharacterized protein LOC106662111 [Cimex lectularius]|uniref:Uncharacterized protein n=1 Tax=Cimex lectularius TaxID=79782 RepID=A0A8I6RCT9_CIMLE|nr:uncharacterized protein LOC106662111 [Cimex lectularius]